MFHFLSPNDRSVLGRWAHTVDFWMLFGMTTLGILGLGLVTLASPAVAVNHNLDAYYFVVRHGVFLVPALGGMLVTSLLSPRQIWRGALFVFALAVFGVVMTLLHGTSIKGATRWVSIAGFSIQPSEFLKPALIILTGYAFAQQKTSEHFPGILIAFAFAVFSAGLLMLQPDFGMTVVILTTVMAQFVLMGMRLRYIVMLIGAMPLIGIAAYVMFDHVRSRVDRFLNPDSGDTFQIDRSLEAFQNGGLMGTGPGAGQVKLQLPDAHADFIFSVAGEELGLWFVLLVILIYLGILLRGLYRLRTNNSVFCVLAGSGLLVMFGLQALVHMASATELMPAKGMTLPFISYGGSSLIAIGLTLGVILALTRTNTNKRYQLNED